MFVGPSITGSYFNRSSNTSRQNLTKPSIRQSISQADITGSQSRANKVAIKTQSNRHAAFKDLTRQGTSSRLPSAIKFAARTTLDESNTASRTADTANAIAQTSGAFADHFEAPASQTARLPKIPDIPPPDYPSASRSTPHIPPPDYPGASRFTPHIPPPDYPNTSRSDHTQTTAKPSTLPKLRTLSNVATTLGGAAGIVDSIQNNDPIKAVIEAGYAIEGAASLGNKIIQRIAPNTTAATSTATIANVTTKALPIITTVASGYGLYNNVKTLLEEPNNTEIVINSVGAIANTLNISSGTTAIAAGITGNTTLAITASSLGAAGGIVGGIGAGLALGAYLDSHGLSHQDVQFGHLF